MGTMYQAHPEATEATCWARRATSRMCPVMLLASPGRPPCAWPGRLTACSRATCRTCAAASISPMQGYKARQQPKHYMTFLIYLYYNGLRSWYMTMHYIAA